MRIITPGTIIEDSILSRETNNFLCCISPEDGTYGIAFCDVSTGEFRTTQTQEDIKLFSEVARYRPSEILLPLSFEQSKMARELQRRGYMLTTHDDRFFFRDKSTRTLKEHFGVSGLEGLGLAGREVASQASGALVSYLHRTQFMNLGNVTRLRPYSIEEYMMLDTPTQRNLELLKNIRDNTTRGTVFEVLNKTRTSMGARKLKNWLLRPLRNTGSIQERLDAVEEFSDDALLREELRELLAQVSDIERIIGRVTYRSANPRDMVSLRMALSSVPELKKKLQGCSSAFVCRLRDMDEHKDLNDLLHKAVKDEPATTIREGNIIRDGYDSQLDELKDISTNGRKWIVQFEEQERKRTGIKNLRVRFNKVFGYFIEVTKANLNLVPKDYIRKQTQVNSERFITEELKEKESMLLGAHDKINALEYDLFTKLLETVAGHTQSLQALARHIARLDCILSLSQVAVENRYTKPAVDEGNRIAIIEGRHPVVERLETGTFVANDLTIGDDSVVHVITGPNMSGKSTYLRQAALITLLAQIGSFVPAREATIGLVDRIFSRVGAYDDLSMGQSTFMVEMSETANILNSASSRSLIIMDEVGRGTSTYDGLALAWSILEFIVNDVGAKTLFATHYHHLNRMASDYAQIANYNIKVDEEGDDVVFMHKIVKGGTDRSYGIHVAKIAGMPDKVLQRSRVIMGTIEEQEQLTHSLSVGNDGSADQEVKEDTAATASGDEGGHVVYATSNGQGGRCDMGSERASRKASKAGDENGRQRTLFDSF